MYQTLETGRSRILFVLKHRPPGTYGSWSYCDNGGHLSSGLNNSVRFIVDMLNKNGIDSKLVHVVDNNCIDREVHSFKPTHVIVEAYWVVPEKFAVLKALYPNIKWIVRNHSKSEFLSNEGVAFGWTLDYLKLGVEVASNSPEAYSDIRRLAISAGLPRELVTYLPNYYPIHWQPADAGDWNTWEDSALANILGFFEGHGYHHHGSGKPVINIGSFGAIRPLKNTLNQALAAIGFADRHNLRLHFHINGNRIEGNGHPIKKNIREIFDRLDDRGYMLIEHPWMDHDKFIELTSQMDLVSQVAFSETFNIVGADAVDAGVPLVGSDQIPPLPTRQVANPSDVSDIIEKYEDVLSMDSHYLQWECLHHYVKLAEKHWVERFDHC